MSKSQKLLAESRLWAQAESMMWVLFRHGEKSTQGHDPELSAFGKEQALVITTKVKQGKLPKPSALYISTKKRTAQTFEPLAQALRLKPVVKAELTERVPGESLDKFRLRIQEFLVRLMLQHQDNEVLYLCTHYDWIEEFLTIVECDSDLSRCTHWPAAQHMVFEKKDIWHLLKYEGL